MKNTLSTALLIGSLTLGSGEVVAGGENNNVEPLKKSTDTTLSLTKKKMTIALNNEDEKTIETEHEKKVKAVIAEIIAKIPEFLLSKEQEVSLISILGQQEFRDKIYALEKKEKIWSPESVALSILLGFLYGWAYFFTIRKIRDKGMPIDAKSFSIFAGTSGMMAVLNGFVPGSLVYAESFVLASISVYLHFQNKRHKVPYDERGLLERMVTDAPVPVVRYSDDGLPIIWNKQMEEATGYTYTEILDYYNEKKLTVPPKEHPYIIMTLLYKGENLKKVRQYLGGVEKSGKGYINIAFTMTTKSGEEKTFLWATLPDGMGGTIRVAQHITDIGEISIELKKTEDFLMEELARTKKELSDEEKLRREIEAESKKDNLTGVYNKKAFDEDMHHLLKGEKGRDIIMATIDIDDFKVFNDKYGHVAGDAVLKKFTQFIQASLHRKGDKLYRVGGDEFIILLESDNFDGVTKRFNNIRHDLSRELIIMGDTRLSGAIESSWGVTKFVTGGHFQEDYIHSTIEEIRSEADIYMYIVKFYKEYLGDELIKQGVITEDTKAKNGVARAIYNSEDILIGIDIYNEQGNFTLTQAEFECIQEKKKNDSLVGKRLV